MTDHDATLDALRTFGFAVLETIPQKEFDDVRHYLHSRQVIIDAHVPQTARNRGDFMLHDRSEAAASECICIHTNDAIRTPHLFEKALSLTDVASEYLGRDPAVAYSANVFWTRPGAAALRDDIQSFHVDQDDVRFLAMFVYLDDVREPADGPQDLEGPDGIKRTIYGKAGTVFLADTMRPHRGRKPTSKERGLYWWRWGVSDKPPAGQWDKIVPIPSSGLGSRYPSNQRLQESIRLLVSP